MPGVDVLQPQDDGTRSATVTVESQTEMHFRYLGSVGTWFDDPDAETTEYGSIIRAEANRPGAADPASIREANPPKKGKNRSKPGP